jgi:hypothetical protein
MIAKRLTIFMGPFNLDARRVNRRASNRHPEQAAGFAVSEGSKPGASSAPDPKTSLLVKLLTSTLAQN